MKKFLMYLYVFFITLAVFSANWAINGFAFLNFDETLFQLTTPVGSAESSILISYLTKSLLVSIFISVLLFYILIKVYKYITHKRIFTISLIILSILIIIICLDKVTFFEYIHNLNTESKFIENNYVNPKEVKITFPDKKKNLIYIYVESLESTYFSKKLGGESNNNYLEPLEDLTKENTNFSDTKKFGGAVMVPGTTWTTGSTVSQTSGLPLKVYINLNNRNSNMLDNAYSLGDILKDNGYNQMYMIGSDSKFGNRGTYFKNHGNYQIYDLNTAKEKKKIDKDYHVWWGYEDSKLFEFAKEEINNLAKEDKPFNFTMLTTDTHHVGGYLEKDCKKKYQEKYDNAIYCSASQVKEFVSWIQKQDFYEDTTIVIVGDHISMQPNLYPRDTKRRIYNLFINSSVEEKNTTNRVFNTMDFFPTTIASLGAEIEGDRLGLGTNLYSNKKTLLEEYGYKEYTKEIKKNSKYYKNNFIKQ